MTGEEASMEAGRRGGTTASKRLACVTYSKDRPLQLDGALRSLRLHARDHELASVSVIFSVSNPRFEAAYSKLALQNPNVEFVRERDFKRDTIAATSPSDYVMFLVDDTVFIRQFEVGRTMDALANDPRLLGFSLRLGCNTRYCYTMDRSQTLPDFKVLDRGMLTFDWTRAEYDFGYPLELSSSVYRTADLLPLLVCLDYSNPNTLETELATVARGFASNQGMLACWETSVAVSVPVNTVQTAWQNRAGENPELSCQSLLRRYEHGSRLDVEAYTGIVPAACHEELALHYVADKTVPTVSVIIPCYSQADYLPDALTSILEQTFEDWEVIVVNDGSPDDTSSVVASLAQANPGSRIRLVESMNRGLAGARNLGVGSALGRYVLPLDADDRLEPTFLEHTVGLLESDESAAIAYTDVRQFGAGSNLIKALDFVLDFARAEPLELLRAIPCGGLARCRGVQPEHAMGLRGLGLLGRRFRTRLHSEAHPGATLLLSHPRRQHVCDSIGARRRAPGTDAAEPSRCLSMGQTCAPLGSVSLCAVPCCIPTPGEPCLAWHRLSRSVLSPSAHSPQVTVIVPTYNYAPYLPAAIDSVRQQSLEDWECVVVDDGSTDETSAVLERLTGEDSRIRSVRRVNLGTSSARNHALSLARGRFIQFLDADDVLHAEKLRTHVAVLDALDDVDIVYGPTAYFAGGVAQGVLRHDIRDPDAPAPPRLDGAGTKVLEVLVWRNVLTVDAPLIRLAAFTEVGVFDQSKRRLEDWDLWLRMALAGRRFMYLPSDTPVAMIRVHQGSLSYVARGMWHAEIGLRRDLSGTLPTERLEHLNDRCLAEVSAHAGIALGLDGHITDGLRLLVAAALSQRRLSWLVWGLALLVSRFPTVGRRLRRRRFGADAA